MSKFKYITLKQNHASIDYDLGHYPFFSIFEGSGVRKVPFKGGYWELRAAKFPTYSALDTMLGLVKAFEDAELRGMVIDGQITEDRKTKTISISKRGLCEFCGKDGSGGNMDVIYEDLKCLSDFVAYKYETGKKRHCEMKRFVLYTNWLTAGHEEVTIAVDADFLVRCKKEYMLVRWREIQKYRSPITKAVLLHLDSNNMYAKQQFTEYRFLKIMGLSSIIGNKCETPNERKERLTTIRRYRIKLKNSLDALATDKLIISWKIDEETQRYEILRDTVYRDKKKRNLRRLKLRQISSAVNDTSKYPGDLPEHEDYSANNWQNDNFLM